MKVKKGMFLKGMSKKNDFICTLTLLMFSLGIACNSPEKHAIESYVNNDSLSSSYYYIYQRALDSNLTEEKNYDLLLDHFFNEPSSNGNLYALFFKYIKNRRDESLSESASFNIYEMFKKYRAKGDEMLGYLNQLPDKERNENLNEIIQTMCLDLNANNYTYDKFKADFSFLLNDSTSDNTKKCFDEWIEE